MKYEIESLNRRFRQATPETILQWVNHQDCRKMASTSFGTYSSVLLHALSIEIPDINVVWCDTGYNNHQTYHHANNLISRFDLNVDVYVPRFTRAFTEFSIGLPSIDDPKHAAFAEMVKIEPFKRAIREHNPEIWLTNIRINQTDFRDNADIFSLSPEGILKVSPFYYWSDEALDSYMDRYNLPKNEHYFDPVKALKHRECGIQQVG
jgi:phosphoadenosine phosphosulfate reductase